MSWQPPSSGVGERREIIHFCFDRPGCGSDFLNQGGYHALDRSVGKVPQAGKLEHGNAVPLRDRADFLQLFEPGLHPSCRAKGPMVPFSEFVAWLDVAVKQAAVVDDACDQFHLLLPGR